MPQENQLAARIAYIIDIKDLFDSVIALANIFETSGIKDSGFLSGGVNDTDSGGISGKRRIESPNLRVDNSCHIRAVSYTSTAGTPVDHTRTPSGRSEDKDAGSSGHY